MTHDGPEDEYLGPPEDPCERPTARDGADYDPIEYGGELPPRWVETAPLHSGASSMARLAVVAKKHSRGSAMKETPAY